MGLLTTIIFFIICCVVGFAFGVWICGKIKGEI